MTAATTSPPLQSVHALRRGSLRTGIVAGCLAVFGYLMGARIGGIGPSLVWSGLFVSALAGGCYAVLKRLSDARVQSIAPLFAAVVATSQVSVLAIVMLEIDSRYHVTPTVEVWVPGNRLTTWHRPHRQLGWAPAMSFEAIVEFDTGPVQVNFNSMGFRDIEQTLDPNRPHVVIIGDSYPIGWGGSFEDSMGPRLREVLPEAQVFNASCTGYAKDQIALSYAVRARPLHPDVVVVMFMVEPGIDDSQPLYQALRKPWFVLRGGELRMKGLPIEFTASADSNRQLYRRWESDRITGPIQAWRFLTREFPRRYLAMGKRLFPAYDWVEIRRSGFPPLTAVESAILADLKRQIEADGARMIVATAPIPAVFTETRDPVAAMRSHLDSFPIGIDVVDLTPHILSDWQKCYNPQSHPNAEGMNRVRGELVKRIHAALRKTQKDR